MSVANSAPLTTAFPLPPARSCERPAKGWTVSSGLRAKVRSLLVILLALFTLLPLAAEAARTQDRRLYLNANGDLTLVGNMLVHCNINATNNTSRTNCGIARSGSAPADNYYSFANTGDLVLVDADADTGTTNSSSADLVMPAGSTVAWAGLYWGARYNATSTTAPALTTAQAAIKLRAPGGAYQTITPTTLDLQASGSTSSGAGFQAFADVTAQVKAGGAGTYWGGGLSTSAVATARNAWAGWALVVVYENAALPFRNFAVYDGMGYISNQTVTLTPSGFLTPLNGPVVSRLGVLLWDGDKQANPSAEALLLNGSSITDAANPVGDVWNSSISRFGANVTTRNPNYPNTLGVDLDLFNVPQGLIPNGATSATIGIKSPGTDEVFWFGAATFTTDVYTPNVIPNVVKTAEDMSPSTPLLPGDTLRWHVVMSNTGYDSATNLLTTDIIPAYLTYVPGSLVVDSGANAGGKSDTAFNDQAEFLTGPDRVVFRLGTGANATQGGILAYGQSTSFYFDTKVNADVPAGTLISNEVQVQYNSQTLPSTTFAASSAAASATVMGPPVITKSFAPTAVEVGQSSLMTITVSNPVNNPGPLTGVAFTDTYPAGLLNTSSPASTMTCTPGSTAGTLTGGTAGGNSIGMTGATIPPNGSCVITVRVSSATAGSYENSATVTATNGGTGNTATATLFVGKPRISKSFAPSTINAGATSTVSFVIQNLVNSAITQVAFTDTLVNMQVAATPAVTGNCNGGTVTAAANGSSIALAGGSLAANASCTITVNVTSSTAGTLPNTTSGVSSLQSGTAGQPSNTAELVVVGPPLISKSFAPVSVRTGTASTLTVVVSNPNTGVALTGVGFNDTYPTGSPSGTLVNSSPSNVQSSCSAGSSAGTLTASSGGGSLAMSGGSIAAGGSCSITVNVQSSSQATFNNISGAVTGSAGAGTLTGGTATAQLIVANRLTATKAFAPTSIAYNDPVTPAYTQSQMTITVSASAPGSGQPATVTGVNYEDVFPVGLIVANTPAATLSCGVGSALQGRTGTGAWGPVASGNTALRVTGGNAANGSPCTATVNVTSNSTGTYTNSTDTVYSGNGGTATPASATLNVLGPPRISKDFDSSSVAVKNGNNNFVLMTITISNPTTATTSLTGLAFDDFFPTGMVVRSGTPAVSNTCGGTLTGSTNGGGSWHAVAANDTAIRLTGGTLAANASCTVSMNVQGTAEGDKINTTTRVTSTNGGSGDPASATLWVGNPPSVTKAFSCAQPIKSGDTCNNMQLFLTNNSTLSALGNILLEDIFPLETPLGGEFKLTGTSPTVTRTAGSGTCPAFTYEGRKGSSDTWGSPLQAGDTAIRIKSPTTGTTTMASGQTCRVDFQVTSNQNSTNMIQSGGLSGTLNGAASSNMNPASAILQVYNPPTLAKSFDAPTVPVGVSVPMTISISNLNNIDATTVNFEDLFPASVPAGGQLVLANGTVGKTGCTGTVQGRTGAGGYGTPVAGNTSIRITGANTITALDDCEITVNVQSATKGSYTNTISQATTANIGNSGAASATLVVMAPPTLTKGFTPDAVMVGETSLLTLVLVNPNPLPITGATLTDNYPGGLVNTATPNATSSCPGAVLTAAANGNSLAISGATIPAGSSCSVSVRVTSATAGSYPNTTGQMTTTNAGNGAAASATLTVSPYLPTLDLLKSVKVLTDPVNCSTAGNPGSCGSNNPKSIPGSVSAYTIRLSNSGPGTVDNNSIFISDVLPHELELFVGTGTGGGAALQNFTFSTSTTPVSGLGCTFSNRNSGSDCVDFSSDINPDPQNPQSINFTYTPNPGADGYDPAVTAIRLRPTGSLSNASGSGNPWAEFSFRVRVK